MNVEEFQSWEEFEHEIGELVKLFSGWKKENPGMADLVFRGQANSNWNLETTMERAMGGKQRITKYYHLIDSIKDSIQSFTNKVWPLPDYPEIKDWIKDNFDELFGFSNLLGFEYIAYLRHHGFPSPLLDWSLSPYVAAYFAFQEIQRDVESVAIFAYVEHLGTKSSSGGKPHIKLLGPHITTDKRHYLQQCEYSICTGLQENIPYFLAHEDVFTDPERSTDLLPQDLLYKYVLPASERKHVLGKLEMFNINDFSLFGSEESLMKTAFTREFVLKS